MYERLPFGHGLLKTVYETQYHFLIQSHCLCSVQEVIKTKFRLPTGKRQSQFLIVFRICRMQNHNIFRKLHHI